MNGEQKKLKFNVLTINETLEELEDIKKELYEVLSGMKAQEMSGKSSYIFKSSTIVFKRGDTVRVKFTDISPKEGNNLHKDMGIREDDIVCFTEEGYDDLDTPKQIKGISIEAKRCECIIEFKIKGKSEEIVLSRQGILKKEFNKNSIETQLSMIRRLISDTKSKRIPLGVIPFVFRISELPNIDMGTPIQWITETFNNRDPDPSQEKAIRQSLQGPAITILKGPPGTGKTSVISEIALQLISNNKTVLITSQTNSALDNIVSRIVNSRENVNLIRIASSPRY